MEGEKMKVTIESTSIKNERTGEVESPKEAIDALRVLEDEITQADEEIVRLKAALKAANERHDKAVIELRSRIRQSRALPLFDGGVQ